MIIQVKKSEGEPFDFISKFNLPVVNALWNVTAGHRFEYNDPKLISMIQVEIRYDNDDDDDDDDDDDADNNDDDDDDDYDAENDDDDDDDDDDYEYDFLEND